MQCGQPKPSELFKVPVHECVHVRQLAPTLGCSTRQMTCLTILLTQPNIDLDPKHSELQWQELASPPLMIPILCPQSHHRRTAMHSVLRAQSSPVHSKSITNFGQPDSIAEVVLCDSLPWCLSVVPAVTVYHSGIALQEVASKPPKRHCLTFRQALHETFQCFCC